MRELLGYRADNLDLDGFSQPRQFFQRIGGSPRLILTLDGDQEGMFGWAGGGMGSVWNGSLLSVIVISNRDELLIVPRRGVVMAVRRGRDPAIPSPCCHVEDLASTDLQVLLGHGDAASFLLQPTPVRLEAVPLQRQVLPNGGSGWSTEDRAFLDETPRRKVGAKPLDLDAELAPNDEQRRGVDHGWGNGACLQSFLSGPTSGQ